MKKFLLLLLSSLLGISAILSGQVIMDTTTINHEHARYKNGDIREVLGEAWLSGKG